MCLKNDLLLCMKICVNITVRLELYLYSHLHFTIRPHSGLTSVSDKCLTFIVINSLLYDRAGVNKGSRVIIIYTSRLTDKTHAVVTCGALLLS